MSSVRFLVDKASRLDSDDPLKKFRSKFFMDDQKLIYLDGNSLGMLPLESVKAIDIQVVENWGKKLIRGYNEKWWNMPDEMGRKISKIIGAQPDEVIVCDSTSVNMFKLAVAALNRNPLKKEIVSDELNFPSDLYIIQGIIKLLNAGHTLRLMKSYDKISVNNAEIENCITDATALASLSYVSFRSSFMYDMKRVTRLVHEKSAYILWDLCHAVGAVPIDLNGSEADMAVGCTYKYLNGGPGSTAFLYVRKDIQEKLDPAICGWWGEANPFEFGTEYRPAPGIKKFLTGSVPILSLTTLDPSLDIILEAGIDRLRHKSLEMSRFLIDLVKEFLFPLGFTLGSPEDENFRGSHVSIRHQEAYRICRALVDPAVGNFSVIPDFRTPDNIRIGLVPLYNTFSDILMAVMEIEYVVKNRSFEDYSTIPEGIT
jgi:kynureninase